MGTELEADLQMNNWEYPGPTLAFAAIGGEKRRHSLLPFL